MAPMGKHMDAKTRALCYFYRHPPRNSGVKPVPYRKIPKLLPVRPRPTRQQVWTAVRTFHLVQKSRGRKKGFRKTTPAEDRCILRAFHKVREPLGSLVESRDVWNELTPALRSKVCLRTVRNRLREKGYAMDEKRAGDDMGEQWRRKRVLFCVKHKKKSQNMWKQTIQGVGDFRFFTFYPKVFKRRHRVKSCKRTYMNQKEKSQTAFQRPRRHIFKRREFKRCSKAKVFGITTSIGTSLTVPCPLHPTACDWIKLLRTRVAPFLAASFPSRSTYTLLLDGETIMRTEEAKEAMKACGVRTLPGWPAHSPDLNPQENVWAWTEKHLRKAEKDTDTLTVFKRRILEITKKYEGKEKLVPSMVERLSLCRKLKGANIGK